MTEIVVFGVGIVMLLVSRHAIEQGLAEGSPARATEVLEQVA